VNVSPPVSAGGGDPLIGIMCPHMCSQMFGFGTCHRISVPTPETSNRWTSRLGLPDTRTKHRFAASATREVRRLVRARAHVWPL
jgi:hypothetical protein